MGSQAVKLDERYRVHDKKWFSEHTARGRVATCLIWHWFGFWLER